MLIFKRSVNKVRRIMDEVSAFRRFRKKGHPKLGEDKEMVVEFFGSQQKSDASTQCLTMEHSDSYSSEDSISIGQCSDIYSLIESMVEEFEEKDAQQVKCSSPSSSVSVATSPSVVFDDNNSWCSGGEFSRRWASTGRVGKMHSPRLDKDIELAWCGLEEELLTDKSYGKLLESSPPPQPTVVKPYFHSARPKISNSSPRRSVGGFDSISSESLYGNCPSPTKAMYGSHAPSPELSFRKIEI